MDMMIVEIFLKAFVLCGLLYLVARNEADFEFAKVAMVTAGITVGTFFIDIFLQPRIGFFSIIPSIAFVVFMIMKFCWAPFWKAILVTFLYLLFNILLAVGIILLIGKMNESAGETVTSKHDADLQEARQMVREMYNMPAPPPPPPPADSGKPPSQAEDLIRMFKQFFSTMGEKPTAAPTPEPVSITVVPAVTAEVKAVAAVPALRPAPPIAVTAAPPASAVKATVTTSAPPARAPEKAPAPPPARTGGFKAMLQNMSGRGGEKMLAPADAPGWDTARAKINVSAVMTGEGDSRVAVVNGQMIEEGTYYTLEYERLIYRWLLKEVKRGRVVWEPAPGEPAVAK